MRKRWPSLAIRVVIATVLAWILATAPVPQLAPQTWVAFVQVPIVVFVLICYIGKLMFDTFFYDHYRT